MFSDHPELNSVWQNLIPFTFNERNGEACLEKMSKKSPWLESGDQKEKKKKGLRNICIERSVVWRKDQMWTLWENTIEYMIDQNVLDINFKEN